MKPSGPGVTQSGDRGESPAAGRRAPPTVSVIVEGYNEWMAQGMVDDTLEGLRRQDYPIGSVEVVLVGSPEQAERWTTEFSGRTDFHAIRALGLRDCDYYEMKNRGAEIATGEILAFTDSDAIPQPGWLSNLVSGLRNGADVVAGVSLFHDRQTKRIGSPLLLLAGSITWGFVVGPPTADGEGAARGFLSHNVGIHRRLFRRHGFCTDYGRMCGGSILYAALEKEGAAVLLQPNQRVSHSFGLAWWLGSLHLRYGYEVRLLRRLGVDVVDLRARRLGPLEPVLTMGWHVVRDVPQWWRYGRILGVGRLRRLVMLPPLLALSLASRSSEIIGMYLSMVTPRWMERLALRS